MDHFKTRQFDCPCEVSQCLYGFFFIYFQNNCPAGCPCDDYPCAETTTAPDQITSTAPTTTTLPTSNAVLVLSTNNAPNKPMVIDWDGKFILENDEMSLNFPI